MADETSRIRRRPRPRARPESFRYRAALPGWGIGLVTTACIVVVILLIVWFLRYRSGQHKQSYHANPSGGLEHLF